jgi:hypothetical protein
MIDLSTIKPGDRVVCVDDMHGYSICVLRRKATVADPAVVNNFIRVIWDDGSGYSVGYLPKRFDLVEENKACPDPVDKRQEQKDPHKGMIKGYDGSYRWF